VSYYQISHDPVPIRLFKSNFLEFFTHISPVTVTAIWLPVAGYFLARSIESASVGTGFAFYIPAGLVLGLFIWTLSEYLLHRFVFHFQPRQAWQERVIFLFHGIHHAQPQCKTRLVMPPVVSAPMAFLFFSLFQDPCEGFAECSRLGRPVVCGLYSRLPGL
jgi:sterol desaturase/sphingolipid hydroxylase (fatty acid hydroxylase superfamily)